MIGMSLSYLIRMHVLFPSVWEAFLKATCSKLLLTIYLPQTNNQSERTIQTFLVCYVYLILIFTRNACNYGYKIVGLCCDTTEIWNGDSLLSTCLTEEFYEQVFNCESSRYRVVLLLLLPKGG